MAHILLIDDEEPVRTVLTKLLEGMGHEVSAVPGGEEGLRAFRKRVPDLVITDLLMPGKSGIQVISELRAEAPALKIIAMTGGGTGGKMNFLSTAKTFPGVQAMNKPIERASLLQTVDALLATA